MKFIFKTFIALLISFVVTKNVSAADYNFKFGTVSADTEPLLDAMRYMVSSTTSARPQKCRAAYQEYKMFRS